MTQGQVIAECREELAQNFGCSSEKISEILTKHGAKLGLIDGDMFRLMCEGIAE
jgi:hypothetical protein